MCRPTLSSEVRFARRQRRAWCTWREDGLVVLDIAAYRTLLAWSQRSWQGALNRGEENTV